jgi:hypothetical protein
MWTEQIIFTATKEDPKHEYVFEDQEFNEVGWSMQRGFSLIGLSRVTTQLTETNSLIICAYVRERLPDWKIVAKSFVFYDIQGDATKVVFYRYKLENGILSSFFNFKLENMKE